MDLARRLKRLRGDHDVHFISTEVSSDSILERVAQLSHSVYEIVTGQIIAALGRGTVPWRKPWSGEAAIPINAVSQKAYRGVNVLLLGLCPYVDPRWLTFKQVQERGGTIKIGERSTMVVFWKQWKPPADEDEVQSKRTIPILRYYCAFHRKRTEFQICNAAFVAA